MLAGVYLTTQYGHFLLVAARPNVRIRVYRPIRFSNTMHIHTRTHTHTHNDHHTRHRTRGSSGLCDCSNRTRFCLCSPPAAPVRRKYLLITAAVKSNRSIGISRTDRWSHGDTARGAGERRAAQLCRTVHRERVRVRCAVWWNLAMGSYAQSCGALQYILHTCARDLDAQSSSTTTRRQQRHRRRYRAFICGQLISNWALFESIYPSAEFMRCTFQTNQNESLLIRVSLSLSCADFTRSSRQAAPG